MKKALIICIVAVISSLRGFTQKIKDADVPSAVKSSFAKVFPGITAKWEKEHENYEAAFKKAGRKMSATFQPAGTFIESETGIKESELPAAALSYLSANFKDKKIKESVKITSARGATTYEAEVDGREVVFDSNGSFIKEVKE